MYYLIQIIIHTKYIYHNYSKETDKRMEKNCIVFKYQYHSRYTKFNRRNKSYFNIGICKIRRSVHDRQAPPSKHSNFDLSWHSQQLYSVFIVPQPLSQLFSPVKHICDIIPVYLIKIDSNDLLYRYPVNS